MNSRELIERLKLAQKRAYADADENDTSVGLATLANMIDEVIADLKNDDASE